CPMSAWEAKMLRRLFRLRITIQGADLKSPIEITDPKILANLNVWTGPGTFSTQPGFSANAPGFSIDWSQGTMSSPPEGLPLYEVAFMRTLEQEDSSMAPGVEHLQQEHTQQLLWGYRGPSGLGVQLVERVATRANPNPPWHARDAANGS